MNQSTAESRGNLIVTVIGAVALIAGLIAGAVALAAAAGVWTGMWDFRRGFEILFAEGSGVTNWAHYVAIVCVLDAIAVFILARALGAAKGGRGATMALVGAVVAFTAYAVPNSYRPSEDQNIPGIHDISTDLTDPPEFVAVLPLRADAPNTTEYGRSEGMTPEELRRLTREAYGDLTTVRLSVGPAEAFDRALAAVNALGWDLVDQSREDGRIEATDTTFWFRFKDDIVIRIREDGQGSAIDARSVSRVGRGDAGTNARRLRAFFDAL